MKQAVIESGRAEFALKIVNSVVKNPNEKLKKEYKSYVRKFPSLVLANGLAAAVAFAFEKGENGKKAAWGILYKNIADWLMRNNYFSEPQTLMEYVCSLNSDEYCIVTSEVLSLFEWLRRFAGGLIEGEANE